MLFDFTLRKDLARSFGATLVVILTIVITIMLIKTLGQAALGRVSAQDVVLLLGFVALSHLPTMLALSLFISVVATLGRMYRDSEMTVWFASGVPLARFVRPVLRMSWPALLIVALLALFVWPWVNKRSIEIRERFERRSDLSRIAPGQFQASSDGRRVFFIERDSQDGRVGRNVFILTTLPNSESVTSARSGRIVIEGDDRYLVLDKGQNNEQDLRDGSKTLARFETYRVLAGERATYSLVSPPPRAQRSIDLLRQPTLPHQGEFVWRLGLILGSANMLLLAVGLAATNPRRPSNWGVLFALLTFVVYYNFINLTQAWVASGKVGMGAALAATHGGAFAIALLMFWWRESRNSGGWLRRALASRARTA
jgi:lipopolysaccharide export system permease protein